MFTVDSVLALRGKGLFAIRANMVVRLMGYVNPSVTTCRIAKRFLDVFYRIMQSLDRAEEGYNSI